MDLSENEQLKQSLDRLVDRILAEDAAHTATLQLNQDIIIRLMTTIAELRQRNEYLEGQLNDRP